MQWIAESNALCNILSEILKKKYEEGIQLVSPEISSCPYLYGLYGIGDGITRRGEVDMISACTIFTWAGHFCSRVRDRRFTLRRRLLGEANDDDHIALYEWAKRPGNVRYLNLKMRESLFDGGAFDQRTESRLEFPKLWHSCLVFNMPLATGRVLWRLLPWRWIQTMTPSRIKQSDHRSHLFLVKANLPTLNVFSPSLAF